MKLPETYSDLTRKVNQYMSAQFERQGYSQLAGKIFSRLLFAQEPLSLTAIASSLGVSKAAISVQVRILEKSGLCYKVPIHNDRNDYYYITERLCLQMIHHQIDQFGKQLDCMNYFLTALPSLSETAPQEQDSIEAFRKRMTELSLLYNDIYDSYKQIDKEWSKQSV
ncbi:GbsR/MarR family transcriptional regulator [Paenibacillus thalictri]|uniref:MarR family transcriptional regulator n=1 Tax=Paenibacillus thalictri TaxID=2527873 RepID=A0A4Q9DZG7_9BACL|nr:MarR family transcriptional regulator [Paenibacillus thalictri]TBL81243.1 MarR family transcriptional regulator [Paenibacillus thalictri]